MKNSLKLLICALTLGVLASVPALRAQDTPTTPPAEGQGGGKKGGKGGPQMTTEQRITRLEDAVGKLTDDQKTKITAIYDKLAKDMAALAPEDRRTKGMDLNQAAQKDVRALLTADQQTKFDAMPPPGRGGKKKGGG